jgi:transcriptional regulator with XRE-family HTH domain
MTRTETLGVSLAHARESRGVSGRALASALGLSPSMVSLFESDDRRPSRSQIRAIGQMLELSEAEIDSLLIAGDHLPAAFDRVPPTDPDVLLVARVLADERLPESDRERFRLAIRLAAWEWQPDSVDLKLLSPQLTPAAAQSGEVDR